MTIILKTIQPFCQRISAVTVYICCWMSNKETLVNSMFIFQGLYAL